MPGADMRSRAASSRTPTPGVSRIAESSEAWPAVTPSEWSSRRSSRPSLETATGRNRFASASESTVGAVVCPDKS